MLKSNCEEYEQKNIKHTFQGNQMCPFNKE